STPTCPETRVAAKTKASFISRRPTTSHLP
ncbi:hypothetical protein TIFTF001_007595, partial [Ficus carica]